MSGDYTKRTRNIIGKWQARVLVRIITVSHLVSWENTLLLLDTVFKYWWKVNWDCNNEDCSERLVLQVGILRIWKYLQFKREISNLILPTRSIQSTVLFGILYKKNWELFTRFLYELSVSKLLRRPW